jgi:hypothetical protein
MSLVRQYANRMIDLANEVDTLAARVKVLEEALRTIGYEQFGPANASHAYVLEGIVELARKTLAASTQDA